MCSSFPFGIEGEMWDVIVLIPDHYLSIYLVTEPSAYSEAETMESVRAFPSLIAFGK